MTEGAFRCLATNVLYKHTQAHQISIKRSLTLVLPEFRGEDSSCVSVGVIELCVR